MSEESMEQKPEAKKNKRLNQVLFWVIVTVLVAIIIWCLSQIIYKVVTDAQDKKEYDSLAASKASASTGVRPTDYTYSTTPGDRPQNTLPGSIAGDNGQDLEPIPGMEGMIREYQLMFTLNNDMVGWIEIPGTDINYPVVQSPYQTDFYLRRNFYKEKATCGAIYAREECDVTLPSDNITLYGHNMANGTMFGPLHKYKEESFWEDNRLVYFDTLYEYHTYQIFAVFNISADSEEFSYHTFDTANTPEEFEEFVKQCKERSLYDTDITPKYGEKLITLSTCDRSLENGRLVVVARKIM